TYTITIAAGGLVISTPLTLGKTNVVAGDTLRGTVTYQNTIGSASCRERVEISVGAAAGTNGAGTYYDLTSAMARTTVQNGANGTTDASAPPTSATHRTTPTFTTSRTITDDCAGCAYAPGALASATYTITIAAGGLVISTPLTLDKTNVVAGDTLRGTVTYQNTSSSPISVQAVIIGGRPPGGTDRKSVV